MRSVAMYAATALLAFASSAAAADEIQLRNDDRLTGDVVSLTGGTLTFKTPYGVLTVPWGEVVALRLDQPMLVTIAGAAARLGTLEGVAVSDVVALAAEQPRLVVSGGANAGWLSAGGNTHVNSLHADGRVVARQRDNRFSTGVAVNRAEDDGRRTARNATGTFSYDRFFSERLFANASTIFTSDTFRGLDLRSAVGAGLGYEAWKGPRTTVSVEAGIGHVRENLADAPTASYAAMREALRAASFIVGKQVQLFHGHDGYFGLTGDDNLFFRMQNGLRLALAGGLVSTFQIDLDYDRTPAPGRKTTDRSTSFTLGYQF